jgi:hypothetical protein
MKRILWAGALALPLLFLTSEAKATTIYCGGYQIDTGANVYCNVKPLNLTMPTAGPWYLYWPYQAYFQVPAPGVNPYFPPPMMLPPGFGQPPVLPQAPPQGYRPPMPAPAAPNPPIQPQGYWNYYR